MVIVGGIVVLGFIGVAIWRLVKAKKGQ